LGVGGKMLVQEEGKTHAAGEWEERGGVRNRFVTA